VAEQLRFRAQIAGANYDDKRGRIVDKPLGEVDQKA
jgi:hypothetical protein